MWRRPHEQRPAGQGARHGPVGASRRCRPGGRRRSFRRESRGRRTRDRRRAHPAQPEPAARPFQRGIDQRARRIRSLSAGCCSRSCCGPSEDGFEIVAGERRWRAAQRARLHTIPAIVREIDEATTAELALIENIQREDLNAIEEADGYRQLIERHGHTQEESAKIVHKSRSHVANLLRLARPS